MLTRISANNQSSESFSSPIHLDVVLKTSTSLVLWSLQLPSWNEKSPIAGTKCNLKIGFIRSTDSNIRIYPVNTSADEDKCQIAAECECDQRENWGQAKGSRNEDDGEKVEEAKMAEANKQQHKQRELVEMDFGISPQHFFEAIPVINGFHYVRSNVWKVFIFSIQYVQEQIRYLT